VPAPRIAIPLLKWFDQHQRPMPWRMTRDPYAIWISEVMLQQTTVAAVIPYFHRFMQSFPTVHALAHADEANVLKHWEGLGYYRRARHLLAAAKIIVAELGGQIPDTMQAIRALPGVGRYIAGAVLSQAFESRVPIVEANTQRLLARLFAYRDAIQSPAGQRFAWEHAEAVLPHRRIGDFNQAMMELGSQICKPFEPDCPRCPIRRFCAANRLGIADQIPPPKPPPQWIRSRELAAVIFRKSRVLIVKRLDSASRWAGFWEFPVALWPRGVSLHDHLRAMVDHSVGLPIESGSILDQFEYSVTRHRVSLTAVRAESLRGRVHLQGPSAYKWARPVDLDQLAMSTPMRRIAKRSMGIF
jgi:A/G-specific adenine glycosylase